MSQVDSLEQLYQKHKDIAEFRIVYINEAHAADGNRPVDYAKKLGITEHDDLKERCTTAEMLLKDKSLSIPFIVDGMDNAVGKAYFAWPDRIFVVRKDGRFAVASEQGPRGFEPGLKDAEKWLAELAKSGEEPELPLEKPKAAQARENNVKKRQ